MSEIEIQGLSKTFQRRRRNDAVQGWRKYFAASLIDTHQAVDALSFTIERGEKIAFIGPNGAGKSTTLKMLCGILQPSSGTALVAGYVPWKETKALSRKLGIVFGQRSQLWQHVSVKDSFDLLARIYSLPQTEYHAQRNRLVALFGIGDLLEQTARSLSLGQRMRCDIVASLLHRPAILFLDEPTIGLDVTAKALLRDHLNALAHQDDTTIILTSHDTDDIESICDRVILIDHGRKVIDTPLVELKRLYLGKKVIRLVTEEAAPALSHADVELIEKAPHMIAFGIDTSKTSLTDIVTSCLQQFNVKDLIVEDQPLDEVLKTIYAARGGQ